MRRRGGARAPSQGTEVGVSAPAGTSGPVDAPPGLERRPRGAGNPAVLEPEPEPAPEPEPRPEPVLVHAAHSPVDTARVSVSRPAITGSTSLPVIA